MAWNIGESRPFAHSRVKQSFERHRHVRSDLGVRNRCAGNRPVRLRDPSAPAERDATSADGQGCPGKLGQGKRALARAKFRARFRSPDQLHSLECRSASTLAEPHALAGPSVSAIRAPLVPKGWRGPSVVSLAVWCSTSALISAPTKTTMAESQIQVMKPIT